ncbi:hypothetical protein BDQ17DRAFT_392155 [Cyathus striatus]|nr:hypothetical protein BDQ17DRAFT_392155 [Cyathus striatus]
MQRARNAGAGSPANQHTQTENKQLYPIPLSTGIPAFLPTARVFSANSPWHTPGGRPIYVNPQYQSPSNHPSFPPPGRIAPADSGLGVLSPPTWPVLAPPRDSAISEEPSTQTPARISTNSFTNTKAKPQLPRRLYPYTRQPPACFA